MAARYTVATKFTGDSSDLKRATAEGAAGATKLADDTEASGKRSNIALAGIAVGAAAMAKSWISAATESQQVSKQTEAVIRSTGGAAKVSAGDVDKLSASLSRKSGVDDEVIASGENVLLTFTKVRNEVGKGNDVFNQATKLALDMSVALGTDMTSASMLLGKALNDPIKGITALTRSGVSFTAQQKDQIKELVASGKTLEAQKLILKELSSEFDGSAEAQATSVGKMKVALGNLSEEVGGVLLPAFDKITGGINAGIDAFESLPGPVHDAATQIIGFGTVGIGAAAGLAFVANKVRDIKGSLGPMLPDLRNASGSLTAFGKALGAVSFAAGVYGMVQLARSFVEFKPDVDRLAEATANLTDANEDWIRKNLAVSGSFDHLNKLVSTVSATNVEAANRLIDVAEANGLAKDKVDELRDITEKKAAADVQAAKDQKTNSDAVKEAIEANESYIDALQRVLDATLAQFDSNLAYRNAVDRTKDGIAELTELTKAGKQGTEEYGDKLRDVEGDLLSQAGAAVKAADDQAKANGVTLDAGTKAQIYRNELVNLQNQFPALKQLLQEYIDKLNEIPSNKNTVLTVETQGKRQSVARSKDAEHRAGGGRVKKGNLYVVGEDHEEYFEPDSDGYIHPELPSSQPRQLAATGSTPEVHLHFDLRGSVNTSGDITRVIAEGVQRARDEGYPI